MTAGNTRASAARGSWRRERWAPLRALEGVHTSPHPDFGLRGTRTVSQPMSAVLSPQVCYSSCRKLIQHGNELTDDSTDVEILMSAKVLLEHCHLHTESLEDQTDSGS